MGAGRKFKREGAGTGAPRCVAVAMICRTIVPALSLACILTAGAAMAQIDPNDSGAGVKRGIQQQNSSGEVGTVTLYDMGPHTRVVVQIDGEPPGRVQPAHLHRAKTCETLDPKPAYPLANVVNGRSSTIVNAPVSRLMSGNYAVNVHASTTNIAHYVACGHLDV